jgi:hypothetical protein
MNIMHTLDRYSNYSLSAAEWQLTEVALGFLVRTKLCSFYAGTLTCVPRESIDLQ